MENQTQKRERRRIAPPFSFLCRYLLKTRGGAKRRLSLLVLYSTAITNQTNHKKLFESVAKQRFQKVSWFERKAL
ncbi:hypothetical protein VB774_00295 [Pseudanabaena galeata UHCC 0370]|uniref:Uncharacterized protein n=1 Tax=Pseudanabaena galeata UHCC 0370 TaxID=3110310 RepID=A0ABU5TCQ6_9CYAN|nr:hypothetical protein [Pseudanabaena galeata]MEA5476048.1 hypothetical protein [Pseudanabaena galeata UHCC 0370]